MKKTQEQSKSDSGFGKIMELSLSSIILLHGLPTRSAVTDVTKSWAPVIRSLSPEKSNLLGFNVGVPLGDPDGWNLLWARSSDLLEAVYDYHQSTKVISFWPWNVYESLLGESGSDL